MENFEQSMTAGNVKAAMKEAGRRMIAHIILSFLQWFQGTGRRFWVIPPPGNRAERRAAAKAARRK